MWTRGSETWTRSGRPRSLWLQPGCLVYSSSLNNEALRSSKMSVNVYQTIRRHIFIANEVKTSNPTSEWTVEKFEVDNINEEISTCMTNCWDHEREWEKIEQNYKPTERKEEGYAGKRILKPVQILSYIIREEKKHKTKIKGTTCMPQVSALIEHTFSKSP
jgi:hypothetical protein